MQDDGDVAVAVFRDCSDETQIAVDARPPLAWITSETDEIRISIDVSDDPQSQ